MSFISVGCGMSHSGEDANRTRTKSTPQIFSAFRNAAISCPRSLGCTNIATAPGKNALKVNDLLLKLGILVKEAYSVSPGSVFDRA